MPPAVTPQPQALALQDLRDASWCGAADPDVIAATDARIPAGDADAWLREWTQAGGAGVGRRQAHRRCRAVPPRRVLLRRRTGAIADSDGSVDEAQLWQRQRDCWDRAVSLAGGEQLSVPYEGARLPGYFLSGGPGRRPLVVIDHGGRALISQAWTLAGPQPMPAAITG